MPQIYCLLQANKLLASSTTKPLIARYPFGSLICVSCPSSISEFANAHVVVLTMVAV